MSVRLPAMRDAGLRCTLEKLTQGGKPIDEAGAEALIQSTQDGGSLSKTERADLEKLLEKAGDQLAPGARRRLQTYLGGGDAGLPPSVGQSAPSTGQSVLGIQIGQLTPPSTDGPAFARDLPALKDDGLRCALEKLYGDGHLSGADVSRLITVAQDGKGLSRTERLDFEKLLRAPGLDLAPEGRVALEELLGLRQPEVSNPPLEKGPLGSQHMTTIDMGRAYRPGDKRFLSVSDSSLQNFMTMSPLWWGSSPMAAIEIYGNTPAEKMLDAFQGDPKVYAFLARTAELGDERGIQIAQDFAAQVTETGVRLSREYGSGDRQVGEGIGAWDVETTVRNIARLVEAGGGDPTKVQIQLAPGAESVPLSEHPYFPGGRHAPFATAPELPTLPLGDVPLKKTFAEIDQQIASGDILRLDDKGINSLLTGNGKHTLEKTVKDTAGNPGRYTFMARCAELWSKGVVDARTDRWRPELEIRKFFADTLPSTKVTYEDLPGLVRMAQAADVPVHLLTYRNAAGEKARLTDHPGWADFVASQG